MVQGNHHLGKQVLFYVPAFTVGKSFHSSDWLSVMSTDLIAVFVALDWIRNIQTERIAKFSNSLSGLMPVYNEEREIKMIW